jgi:hypothetical protein
LNEEKILARPDKGCRPLFGPQGETVQTIVALEHKPTVTLVIALGGSVDPSHGRELYERVKDTPNVSVYLVSPDGQFIVPEERTPRSRV